MPQRRRYATRDELVSLLFADISTDISRDPAEVIDKFAVGAVVEALAARGIDPAALVKVTVDEDVAPDFR